MNKKFDDAFGPLSEDVESVVYLIKFIWILKMLFKLFEDFVNMKGIICGIVATIICNSNSHLILSMVADVNNFVGSILEIITMFFEFASNTLI